MGLAPRGVEAGFALASATALAALLAPLNSTLIAVGLPAIRSHFGVGVGPITLLISLYLVAVAVTQPVGGRLGDALGHVRVVRVGLVVVTVFSVAAAFAPSFWFLVLVRAVQGVAAGLVAPNATALLRKRTAPEHLGSALGWNGAAISAGAAFGPLLGGAALVIGDWQLLLLANVPLALLALGLNLRLQPDSGAGRRALSLDLRSLVLLTLAFGAMVLVGAASRMDNPGYAIAGAIVLPIAVGAYLLRYRRARAGVVDLNLFTRRNFAAASAGTGLTNLVMYSILVSIPVYFADVRGAADHTVSFMLFAMSVFMVGIGPVAGQLSDRIGRRPLIVAGAVVTLAAAVGLAAVLQSPPLLLILIPLSLVGAGLGIASAAQSSTALGAWPPERAGSAAGTYSMMRYVGSVTGTAIIAAVLGHHPGEADFRLLFLILAGFGVANVGVSWLVREPAVRIAGRVQEPSVVR